MARACAAAPAAGSATSSSAMRPTRRPTGGASAPSESRVSAGLGECGVASTAAPSPPGPDVPGAQRSADARATGRTTPPVAGMAGPGSGPARRCWSAIDIAVEDAAPRASGLKSTTLCRSRVPARTSPPTCGRFASHATASDAYPAAYCELRRGLARHKQEIVFTDLVGGLD